MQANGWDRFGYQEGLLCSVGSVGTYGGVLLGVLRDCFCWFIFPILRVWVASNPTLGARKKSNL